MPVLGNFTGDSEEDVTIPEDFFGSSGVVGSREFPFQRDEVKSTIKTNSTSLRSPKSGTDLDDQTGTGKHYIGFVIGILTVVILILVAAIVFIVFRNQKLKTIGHLTTIPSMGENSKRPDCEKVRDFLFTSVCTRKCHNTKYFSNLVNLTSIVNQEKIYLLMHGHTHYNIFY